MGGGEGVSSMAGGGTSISRSFFRFPGRGQPPEHAPVLMLYLGAPKGNQHTYTGTFKGSPPPPPINWYPGEMFSICQKILGMKLLK